MIVENPHTLATAIKIGNPYSWKNAEEARDQSKGVIEAVTDDEILEAYQHVASTEGIFCEPASAASLAGVIKKNKTKLFHRRPKADCLHPDRARIERPGPGGGVCSQKPMVLKPEMGEILKALKILN